MPHANIWIRKENWKKWLATNKGPWINALLENSPEGSPVGVCEHKVNRRTGICEQCGEYVR